LSDIDQHVRHLVGIATLRRLRRMVDGDTVKDADASRWAKRLGILFAAIAVIFVVGLALFSAH